MMIEIDNIEIEGGQKDVSSSRWDQILQKNHRGYVRLPVSSILPIFKRSHGRNG